MSYINSGIFYNLKVTKNKSISLLIKKRHHPRYNIGYLIKELLSMKTSAIRWVTTYF